MKRLICISYIFLAFFCLKINAKDTWTWKNPIPQGNDLKDIHIFDANNAIVVGMAGTIMKTTDGGANWNIQYRVDSSYNDLNSVFFIDNNTGWAVGGGLGVYQGGDVILKTTDGGTNWTVQSQGNFLDLYDVYFFDADTGWACGQSGTLIKTINGGATWSGLTTGTTNSLRKIQFTDSVTGWVSGLSGTIFKTENGGTNWTDISYATAISFYS